MSNFHVRRRGEPLNLKHQLNPPIVISTLLGASGSTAEPPPDPQRPEPPDPENDFHVIPAETPEAIGQRLLEVVTERTPRRFGWTYAPGDKVIQTENDYDKEVFNRDIGCILRINEEEGTVEIDFDRRNVDYAYGELDEISLAYATTAHKSQGSEYPAVVVPLATQHYQLLERNLLYTAVTRGRRLVVVIGLVRALAIAVKRVGSVKRLTYLKQRLEGIVESVGR